MFFERHGGGERVILVHLDGQDPEAREDPQEFQELANSAGAETVAFFNVPRHRPTAKFLIGSGKVEELRDLVKAEQVELVIFNHILTPSQERNLERVFECRVIDRTGLILDIFAQRARTHEGKLQVELAQLDHMSTRLVRGWTHLERQGGGIGMRGPGETQLETDRRLIGVKVKQLKTRLEKLQKQRQTQRRQRERRGQFTVAIVGYTNAGKSTLFNAIASDKAYAADQLFATLDTTTRRVWLAPKVDMALSDTVGFIRDLSHSLVDAFKATLESAVHADVLLHVVDASSPVRHTAPIPWAYAASRMPWAAQAAASNCSDFGTLKCSCKRAITTTTSGAEASIGAIRQSRPSNSSSKNRRSLAKKHSNVLSMPFN